MDASALSLPVALPLGLLLGMRHALEPDHLAALSTLVARKEAAPSGRLTGAWLGASWGLGHGLSLLAVALLLAVFPGRLPAALTNAFELIVAVMLVGLGLRAVLGARREGGTARAGAQAAPPPPDTRWTLARRPLTVGLIHGLAGSGALMALVAAGIPTLPARLLYVALFGAGSVVGMSALTTLAGWPLARLTRGSALARRLSLVTGGTSMILGLWWGWSVIRSLATT